MGTHKASWRPFGLGLTKPRHFTSMLRVVWENRDNLAYGWRILNQGVCDGCSLGTTGMRDNTLEGVHLCMMRLKLLRLNTMPALELSEMGDLAALRKCDNGELRRMGRLAYPMVRRRGEKSFRRLSWRDALDLVAGELRRVEPARWALFNTSRGLTNEVYYVAAKFARLLGTNNIDNSARLCHAASTTAMKAMLGVAASTCSYKDWIGTDLLVLFGTDMANNQPVSVKYLHHAKEQGTRIVSVNPFREPGLDAYWIPSIPKSALFGTRLVDDYYPVRVGGDVAFINGVLKILLERGQLDEKFIAGHTEGFEELKQALSGQSWEELEKLSGLTRTEMENFAEVYANAKTAVFIWSMGLTQHEFGVENVKAVVNLALARGMIGQEKCGVVPIRGHSGVQGAAECGSVPAVLPGGFPVNKENAQRFKKLWGHEPPTTKGLEAPQMLEAAHRGELDLLYNMGGNFFETMPDPDFVREAFDKLKFRVHQDITLNTSMLLDSDTVLFLPALTRYEQPGGGTSTSTERTIWFSPEVEGPRPGEARCEWQILCNLAQRVLPPGKREALNFPSAQAIRQEMDRVMPMYKGIGELRKQGDYVQYGGERLCEGGVFSKMPGGRARFAPLALPRSGIHDGGDGERDRGAHKFLLTSRRGSQFNSMIFDSRDPLTGAERNEVFLSREDARELGIRNGERIRLRSSVGEYDGRARIGEVARGCLVGFWPEINCLLRRRYDPSSGEPDYNVTVSLEKVSS